MIWDKNVATPEYRKYVRSSVERRARRNQFDDKGADGAKKITN